MEQRKHIRAERVVGRSLAVVYNGGELGKEVLGKFKDKGLKVIHAEIEVVDFPVLEKPKYIVFFVSSGFDSEKIKREWREVLGIAKINDARLAVCFDNIPAGIEQRIITEAKSEGVAARLIEIRGEFLTQEDVALAAEKIVHEIFSFEEGKNRLLLFGQKKSQSPFREIENDKKVVYKKKTVVWEKWLAIISLVVIVFFAPLVVSAVVTSWGIVELKSSGKFLTAGKFDEAKEEANKSSKKIALASNIVSFWENGSKWAGLGKVADDYYNLLGVIKTGAGVVSRGATVAKMARTMFTGVITADGKPLDVNKAVAEIKPELSVIERDLSLLEAQWDIVTETGLTIGGFFGIDEKRLVETKEGIKTGKKLFRQVEDFLDVLPDIVGSNGSGRRNYMVVLQNSSELRPTGGFIGSYAIVSFDNGRLLDFKINDIYSADGQLRGQIQPPDEILHFLGQPSWYMRDANWAADWALTARRIEWFLEKETGQKVAGVWAVSLPAVQKLLVATGPINLSDLNQTVSAADFYRKAEYASEINFFPGSTQKKDFLGAVASGLLDSLLSTKEKDWSSLGQAVGKALNAKDLLFYFDDERVQGRIERAGWGGAITSGNCGEVRTNCLMIVDANMGANKANYFLTRKVVVDTIIGKDGDVDNRVTVFYQNNSPSGSWPGGIYKNYVRFLVPKDAQVSSFDLGDGRKQVISTILTAETLRGIVPSQFLVFKNYELTAKTTGQTDNTLLSFGSYFEVPVGESRTVGFTYRSGYRLNFGAEATSLPFTLLRQPGAGMDNVELIVEYPAFLQPVKLEGALVFDQKLRYNTELSQDRSYEVNFIRR